MYHIKKHTVIIFGSVFLICIIYICVDMITFHMNQPVQEDTFSKEELDYLTSKNDMRCVTFQAKVIDKNLDTITIEGAQGNWSGKYKILLSEDLKIVNKSGKDIKPNKIISGMNLEITFINTDVLFDNMEFVEYVLKIVCN